MAVKKTKITNSKRRAKGRADTQSRYLAGQKLSDYQIEKIIRSYAHGISASDFIKAGASAKKPGPSENTVFKIYDLIRKRLLEIRYYIPPEEDYDYWEDDPEAQRHFPFSETAAYIAKARARHRGATRETAIYHLAEIHFRAKNPTFPPDAFFRDIKLAIKITGPLNRPPANMDIWFAWLRILMLQNMAMVIRTTSFSLPVDHSALLNSLQEGIAAGYTKLRQSMRARRTRGHEPGEDAS